MSTEYKRICEGIKLADGKNYIATISVTPFRNDNRNIHLGSFKELSEAQDTLEKAEEIKKQLKGTALLDALDELRYQNIYLPVSCCGRKLKKSYTVCPFCGKTREQLKMEQKIEKQTKHKTKDRIIHINISDADMAYLEDYLKNMGYIYSVGME